MELARRGFVIENEWYWRITENAKTFDVTVAIRDFLVPLARFAKDTIAIADVAADPDQITFTVDGEPASIKVASGVADRVAVSHFVSDLNRVLAAKKHAFALLVPRRYELQGTLVTDEELAELIGRPELLVPSGRNSSGSMRLS